MLKQIQAQMAALPLHYSTADGRSQPHIHFALHSSCKSKLEGFPPVFISSSLPLVC